MANVAKTMKKDVKKAIKEAKTVSDEQVLQFIKDISMLHKRITKLEDELDASYKQQDEMLVEVERFVDVAESGFEAVIDSTGEITMEDVIYHLNFFKRRMKNVYGIKPETSEE